jgi:hypothetical protein
MLPFLSYFFLLLNNRDVRAIANEYILTYLLADTQWLNVYKCRKIDGIRKKQKEKLHFILDAKNKL